MKAPSEEIYMYGMSAQGT